MRWNRYFNIWLTSSYLLARRSETCLFCVPCSLLSFCTFSFEFKLVANLHLAFDTYMYLDATNNLLWNDFGVKKVIFIWSENSRLFFISQNESRKDFLSTRVHFPKIPSNCIQMIGIKKNSPTCLVYSFYLWQF